MQSADILLKNRRKAYHCLQNNDESLIFAYGHAIEKLVIRAQNASPYCVNAQWASPWWKSRWEFWEVLWKELPNTDQACLINILIAKAIPEYSSNSLRFHLFTNQKPELTVSALASDPKISNIAHHSIEIKEVKKKRIQQNIHYHWMHSEGDQQDDSNGCIYWEIVTGNVADIG